MINLRRRRLSAAAALAAMLTGLASAQVAPANSKSFEAASIRERRDNLSDFPVCGARLGLQVSPGRFNATNTTLFALVTWAYGVRYSCFIVNDQGLVSGGPKWVLNARFDVQATFPPGAATYTTQQLQNGDAPELQEMLRALLEERFKLTVHRIMKEVPTYELTIGAIGPRLAASRSADNKFAGIGLEPDEKNEILVHLQGNKSTIDDLAHAIEPVTHAPVLDRTGLKGDYSFDVKFAVIEPFAGPLNNLVGATSPTIFSVFDKELGLKLARSKGLVEQLVIDTAEKPTEN